MTNNANNNELRRSILRVVKEKNPQSVKQLITILQKTVNSPENEIIGAILELQAQGEIQLEDQNRNQRNLSTFVIEEGYWYLFTIAAGAITAALIFTIPENFFPWAYIRNLFGVIFVLFLPGYSFTKALFPNISSNKTSTGSIETITRIGLSVGLSIALVTIVGLFLYYSPWNLDLTSIVLSLFAVTSIFATAGLVRANYQANKRA